ncbi:GNAT family N-acetyltransferase [Streptomyces diastaticus]|uniref:Lysine N-acyltransferase MbtK n=1 Tax=Streptomyces griseus TaxID=1911 RepID=A0A380PBB2_STRGR|nr:MULTISPECIES: GNAT family N-acetyltransferase [Streptomyces]NEE42508.1 acetyltransferase [Streptomyces sp. SID7982]WSU37793.1 acetyltransferase [Streptomyces gougerotii]PJM84931.1 GNAT family N-acetyltransferase [Streptomyces sp. TSRI0384-2]WPR51179.1 GNAT family N-acetyltransferase [Streptomyces sp. S399]SUP62486.1 IucA/IucC [Streptomyces griseus]
MTAPRTATVRPDRLAIRPLDLDADAGLVHGWVTHPKSAFWLMQGLSVDEVRAEYASIAANPHHDAFIGLYEGSPAFLMERYDPAHVELVGLYAPEPGDVGMHFLCAPAGTPLHGFTRAVIFAVMEYLFADPDTVRVVVEPDVRNTAVHALNEAVGFEVVEKIAKPEKEAYLSVCTRDAFEAARKKAATAQAGDETKEQAPR